MTRRITVPEGKVAPVLDRQLAEELSSLFKLIGGCTTAKIEITKGMKEIAKEAWFDLMLAMEQRS